MNAMLIVSVAIASGGIGYLVGFFDCFRIARKTIQELRLTITRGDEQ